ncbi:MAG: hypothetical protein C0490_16470 [Marivirga sp.]|nr:hypothetical protein [Marivirga sp.]
MREEFLVYRIDQLEQISREIRIFGSRKKKITVHLSFLGQEENKVIESTVNKYYAACGCSHGRATGVFTLIAYGILLSTGILSVYNMGIGKTILLYFACSTVAMIIGKIYGVRQARRSLKQLADHLRSNLPQLLTRYNYSISMQRNSGTY